jgi:hypothetical protein
MAREAKERETKRRRTVTVPLEVIARKEDLEMETIELQNKQVILTNAVDELSYIVACIARKSTLFVRHWINIASWVILI